MFITFRKTQWFPPTPSDSIIFLYLGIAMVNYQMYQWDPVFISVTFFLCLFVRSDNIQNVDSID